MKKILIIAIGMLAFVLPAFADTLPNNVYQCEAIMEEPRATIRSKFIFDGNSGGTSFNYIQSYHIIVYRQIDEDSPRVYLTINGSISGHMGSFGYPIYQSGVQSPMIVNFSIPAFGTTIKVTCEKE